MDHWSAQRGEACVAAAVDGATEGLGPFGAAARLLQGERLQLPKSGSAAGDFEAACQALTMSVHPAVLSALQAAESGVVDIRGGKICDAGALSALLVALASNASLFALRFWQCALSSGGINLLSQALPESVTSISIGAEDDGVALSPLLKLPKLTTASLRCCAVATQEALAIEASLSTNPCLISLSLFSCGLGDEGAVPLLRSLRHNSTLTFLGLASNRLSDASARAVLEAVAPESTTNEAGKSGGEAGDKEDNGAPNRALTALDLSFNLIGGPGRRTLEEATAASPALERLELAGNPCLRAGPTASLSSAARKAIAATWEALGEQQRDEETDGVASNGQLAVAAMLCERVLAGTEVRGVGGADGEAASLAEATRRRIGALVALLPAPEELCAPLAELGSMAASRGFPLSQIEAAGEASLEASLSPHRHRAASSHDPARDRCFSRLYPRCWAANSWKRRRRRGARRTPLRSRRSWRSIRRGSDPSFSWPRRRRRQLPARLGTERTEEQDQVQDAGGEAVRLRMGGESDIGAPRRCGKIGIRNASQLGSISPPPTV